MKLKLSIIIPSFNAEKFIEQCIYSALNQDLNPSDYEIIVVDDGSTDRTREVISNISGKFSNVILIPQKNNGAGCASNIGLTKAQGEYILFMDHDDAIAQGSVRRLVEIAYEQNLDILMADFSCKKPGELPVKNSSFQPNTTEVISGQQFLQVNTISWPAWAYLFNKEFLLKHQLQFREGRMFADADFSIKSIYYAQRMKYVNIYFYFFNHNPKSVTRSLWSVKKLDDQLESARAINLFAFSIKNSDTVTYLLMQPHAHALYWSALKNSTDCGFYETLKISNAIKLEFLINEPIKHTFVLMLIYKLIRLSPFFAACLIYPSARSLRFLKKLRIF